MTLVDHATSEAVAAIKQYKMSWGLQEYCKPTFCFSGLGTVAFRGAAPVSTLKYGHELLHPYGLQRPLKLALASDEED
jgi:hypothetical protein